MTTKILQRIFTLLHFFCIYWFVYLYVETITLIIARVKEDYELVSDNEELNIIENYTKESKYYILFMIVFSNMYIFIMTFPSLLKVILYNFGTLDDIHLTLPLSIDVVFDVGLLYYCLLIYQIIILYVILTIGIIIISSYLVLLQHASSQFSIIIMRIRRPFLKVQSNSIKLYDEFDWLIDIIRRYNRASELIDLINSFTEMVLLITFFFGMLLVILNFVCIYQLSADFNYSRLSIEMVVFIVFSMFGVYIFCYIGQKLLDHSHTIFKELCQVPFYMLSVKTQKLFLILITRSMKPSSLSIGGLFVASHEVFAALLRKACSVATVFYNIRS